MSSSIKPTEINFLSDQKVTFENRNFKGQLEVTIKHDEDTKEASILADNLATESLNLNEIKVRLEEELLSESFNKLFSKDNSISLMQSRSLEFSVGDFEGKTVVKVVDKDSKDVIRQIPSEEFIKMAQRIDILSEKMQEARGVLLDKQV